MAERLFNWKRDELILACNLAVNRGWESVREKDSDVIELSELLRKMPLHPVEGRSPKFRSPGSVKAKVENLRTSRPTYDGEGTRAGSLDAEVVKEFLAKPLEMRTRAFVIRGQIEGGTYAPSPDVAESAKDDSDLQIRLDAMAWLRKLDDQGESIITRPRAAEFEFEGRRIPLMNQRRGIWKPAFMEAALSITTTKARPSRGRAEHDDTIGPDDLLRYEYYRGGGDHPDNVALRRAFELRVPLIWFQAVEEGRYLPWHPVFVIGDEPDLQRFVIALDEDQADAPTSESPPTIKKQYGERTTFYRIHQGKFSAKVRTAYDHTCAVCGLRVPGLIDAAHIIADRKPQGDPETHNGLALCKLHHQAYDDNLFSIRPDDLVIEVRPDILGNPDDSAMFKCGLQDIHHTRIRSPRNRSDQPKWERLDIRYHEFLALV